MKIEDKNPEAVKIQEKILKQWKLKITQAAKSWILGGEHQAVAEKGIQDIFFYIETSAFHSFGQTDFFLLWPKSSDIEGESSPFTASWIPLM